MQCRLGKLNCLSSIKHCVRISMPCPSSKYICIYVCIVTICIYTAHATVHKARGLPILQKKCAQIALVNKSNKKYHVIILQQQDTLAVYLLLSLFLFPLLSLSCSFHISSPRVVVAAVFQRNIAYQIELHLNISPFATATLTHTHIHTHKQHSSPVQLYRVQLSSARLSA